MKTLPYKSVSSPGFFAVEKALTEGPVQIVGKETPLYVVLVEEQYLELLEDSAAERIALAEREIQEGKCREFTADGLMDEMLKN